MIQGQDFTLIFFPLFAFPVSMRGINSLTEVTGLHQHGDLVFWIVLGVQQFSAVTTQSHSLPARRRTGVQIPALLSSPEGMLAALELLLLQSHLFQRVLLGALGSQFASWMSQQSVTDVMCG